jgi:hypothetical protein
MAWACASRDAGVASMVAAAPPSKLLLTTFWMVGISRLPVIAARHDASSAFQFVTIVASAFQLYQTGLASAMALPFCCTEVRALPSHGGIHAAMRYANDAGAIVSKSKNAKRVLDGFTFGSPAVWLFARPETLRPPVAEGLPLSLCEIK